jgi:hypothetical protein
MSSGLLLQVCNLFSLVLLFLLICLILLLEPAVFSPFFGHGVFYKQIHTLVNVSAYDIMPKTNKYNIKGLFLPLSFLFSSLLLPTSSSLIHCTVHKVDWRETPNAEFMSTFKGKFAAADIDPPYKGIIFHFFECCCLLFVTSAYR